MTAGIPASQNEPEKVGRGTVIDGRYYVLGLIGRGGQSIVYEAMHMSLGHRVAIKFLAKMTDAKALSRFEQEARLAASIVHPHLCRSFDMGTLPSGTRYIVMERLQGESLVRLVARKPMISPGLAVHITLQVLAALSAAHAARVVHRDIKPGNVFVELLPGVEPIAKVLDFGFAKVFGGGSSIRTTIGRPVGTPAYMSPEQLSGATVDARTDLFSTGVMLYEALTGRRPFDAKTMPELMASILRDVPPPVSSLRPSVPRALDTIVMRAMAKDPSERFATAQAFQRALRDVPALEQPGVVPSHQGLPSMVDSDDDS